MSDLKYKYFLRIADNAMILGQRLSEWCGHGPILEQDMALTNIALDQIGEARLLYQLISELFPEKGDEDKIAFTRDISAYYNCLLVEQPNGNFADTIARQYLFDSFNFHFHQALQNVDDQRIKEIGAKCLKEVTYHRRWSSEWIKRLALGTEVSHQKLQDAINKIWKYANECITPDALDNEAHANCLGPDINQVSSIVSEERAQLLDSVGITVPENTWFLSGGKTGSHSEYMGYVLAEMQYMQRAYPDMQW